MFTHLRHRPGLVTGTIAGVAASLIARSVFPPLSATLVGWCAGIVVYLAMDVWVASRATVHTMQARAEAVDEGRLAVLVITVGAAIASLGAIVANLAQARGVGESSPALTLAAVTVLLSWIFMHTVFAFTYAHDFYRSGRGGGLAYPETPQPNYWDFAYFSFVIGATAQVSDVSITSQSIRRMVLAHGIISFFFNTAVLALGVNLAAGLVG